MTILLLHDLILGQSAVGICVHDVVSALVQILHKAQVERTAAILVALELGNGCLGSLS
jgi:hypothetical protein